MFLFRSSFITAAFVCVIAIISQCTIVSATPLGGMWHAFNADVSSSIAADTPEPTVSSAVDVPSPSPVAAALGAADESPAAPENTAPPDPVVAAESNGAFRTKSGLGVAFAIGSITAALQIL